MKIKRDRDTDKKKQKYHAINSNSMACVGIYGTGKSFKDSKNWNISSDRSAISIRKDSKNIKNIV